MNLAVHLEPVVHHLCFLLVACLFEFYYTEVGNIVNIYTADSLTFAGDSYSLNCTVVSDIQPVVKWIDPDGNPVNVNGINIDEPVYYGNNTYVLLRIHALRTSQGGVYTCQSEVFVNSEVSVRNSTKELIVTGK